jgi:hypothetical protein
MFGPTGTGILRADLLSVDGCRDCWFSELPQILDGFLRQLYLRYARATFSMLMLSRDYISKGDKDRRRNPWITVALNPLYLDLHPPYICIGLIC